MHRKSAGQPARVDMRAKVVPVQWDATNHVTGADQGQLDHILRVLALIVPRVPVVAVVVAQAGEPANLGVVLVASPGGDQVASLPVDRGPDPGVNQGEVVQSVKGERVWFKGNFRSSQHRHLG